MAWASATSPTMALRISSGATCATGRSVSGSPLGTRTSTKGRRWVAQEAVGVAGALAAFAELADHFVERRTDAVPSATNAPQFPCDSQYAVFVDWGLSGDDLSREPA